MASKNISFNSIEDGIKETGAYIEQDTSQATRANAAGVRRGLVLAQRLKARIEPEIWQGGALDDLTKGGAYTGLAVKKFRVKVSTAAGTDQFQWSADDGGAWSAGINITGAAQALSDGVTVTFGATTGHALNDEWRFNAYPEPSVAEKVAYAVFSASEAEAHAGSGSPAHLMAEAAIKKNPLIDLTLVTLDDNAAGVAATGTTTFTGAATSAGTVRRYFGHQYVDVGIAVGDTPTMLATKTCNAVAAKPSLPVVASNVAGVVTYTSKNKGTCGNIRIAYTLTGGSGVGIADVAMANGATDPDIQDALDVVAGTRFQVQCSQWNDQTSIDAFEAQLDLVSSWNDPHAAVGIFASVGALASATTLALNTNALRVATPYCRYASATKKQDAAYILAAIFLGAESSRKPTDPAMDVDMTGISLPDTADRLSWTERRTCLNSGVSPIKIMAGERPVLPRVPVTYCRSASGGNVFVDIHKVTGWDNHRDEAKADIEAYAPKKIQEQDEDHPLSTLDIMTSIVLGTAYRLQSKGELTGVKRREAYFLCEVDIDNPGQINILMPSPVPEGNYVKAIKQVCL